MEFGPTIRNICLIQGGDSNSKPSLDQIKGQLSTKPCSVPQNMVEIPPQSSPKNVKRLSEQSVRANFDRVLFEGVFQGTTSQTSRAAK